MNKADLRPYVVFILARRYSEAEDFARAYLHGQQPFTMIDSAEQMRGLRGFHVVRLKGWRDRPHFPELSAMLAERGAVDVTAEFRDAHYVE